MTHAALQCAAWDWLRARFHEVEIELPSISRVAISGEIPGKIFRSGFDQFGLVLMGLVAAVVLCLIEGSIGLAQ